MSDREKWRYVHKLNIYQIVLLIEGYNPAEFDCSASHSWDSKVQRATAAMLTALKHSIEDESLPLDKQVYHEDYGDGRDYEHSLVHVDKLRRWMVGIGHPDSFFHSNELKSEPEFDHPFDKFYAPKLAAAMAAWQAVTADPRLLRGKSPKQALEAWLRKNAARYDLLNKDGSPNATGIEEIAKVANWKPTGGAPSTPEADEPTPEFRKSPGWVQPEPIPGLATEEDSEIPF